MLLPLRLLANAAANDCCYHGRRRPLVMAAVQLLPNAAGIVSFQASYRCKNARHPISSAIDVYDALGNAHTVTLNWVQNAGKHTGPCRSTCLTRPCNRQIAVPPT